MQQATSCRAFYIPTHFTHSLRSPFSPYALKGQKLLAQGIALGFYCRKLVALFYSN